MIIDKTAAREQIKAICSELPVFPPNLNKTGGFVHERGEMRCAIRVEKVCGIRADLLHCVNCLRPVASEDQDGLDGEMVGDEGTVVVGLDNGLEAGAVEALVPNIIDGFLILAPSVVGEVVVSDNR